MRYRLDIEAKIVKYPLRYMAGEVYRFLLRMPTQLRERLKDATDESGRSLNAEIVSRLEQSLAETRKGTARVAIDGEPAILESPLRLTVEPRALRLLVPPE